MRQLTGLSDGWSGVINDTASTSTLTGLLIARERLDLNVPLVIRLVGTNQEEGRAILEGAGLTAGDDLNTAVRDVIAKAKEA